MSNVVQLVVFRLDGQRYALPLDVVERTVRAVEVTPLPKAPAIVLGMIDVGGSLLPVLDIRSRFQLPEHPVSPSDQFLIARAGQRAVVLVVDEVQDVISRASSDIVGVAQLVPGLEQVRGAVRLDDGLVLIQDLEKFLSLNEARVLDEAMNAGVPRGA